MFCTNNENVKLTRSRLWLLCSQGQLFPVPAGRKELSPLVEGCNTWCEEDVEFFEEAEATGFAGDVVASQLLFQEVPGDGEVGALPSELVDVPAQGGAWLVLVLLLHVVSVPVVPPPEWAPCQPCVGLHAVARVSGGDGGLVHHPWCLAPARQGAGWLVLAVAALVGEEGLPGLCNHLGVVLCQHLSHIWHRSVACLHSVCIEGAPQNVTRGETLSNDPHEGFRDIGGAVAGEGGVEPGYAALPVVPPPPHLLLLHPGLV